MNPTELQRRLDTAALAPEPAGEEDWARNVALVRARRRRNRVGSAVVAAVAAAAVVAVAVNWPAPRPVRVVPASPAADENVRPVDVSTMATQARDCARVAQVPDGTWTAVFAARSSVASAVTIRLTSGRLALCDVWPGTPASGALWLNFEADAGGPNEGYVTSADDDPEQGTQRLSIVGFDPTGFQRVVVTDADGREFDAALADGYWWAPAVTPLGDDQRLTWRAYDAQGVLVDSSDRHR